MNYHDVNVHYFIPSVIRQSEIDVYYKKAVRYDDLPLVRNPSEAQLYLRKVWSTKIGKKQEFMVLFLNHSNKVMGWARVLCGSLNVFMDERTTIYQIGIRANARGMIFAHNHISEHIEPGEKEIEFIEQLKNTDEVLGITFVDYIIINLDMYYSYTEIAMADTVDTLA